MKLRMVGMLSCVVLVIVVSLGSARPAFGCGGGMGGTGCKAPTNHLPFSPVLMWVNTFTLVLP